MTAEVEPLDVMMSRILTIALLACALVLGTADGRSLAGNNDDDDYHKGRNSQKYHGKRHNNRWTS